MAVSLARFVIAVFSLVCGIVSVRCLRDARTGGDFGQVYSWAFGVGFGVVSAGGVLVVWLLS